MDNICDDIYRPEVWNKLAFIDKVIFTGRLIQYLPDQSQYSRRLAERALDKINPVLIDRLYKDTKFRDADNQLNAWTKAKYIDLDSVDFDRQKIGEEFIEQFKLLFGIESKIKLIFKDLNIDADTNLDADGETILIEVNQENSKSASKLEFLSSLRHELHHALLKNDRLKLLYTLEPLSEEKIERAQIEAPLTDLLMDKFCKTTTQPCSTSDLGGIYYRVPEEAKAFTLVHNFRKFLRPTKIDMDYYINYKIPKLLL